MEGWRHFVVCNNDVTLVRLRGTESLLEGRWFPESLVVIFSVLEGTGSFCRAIDSSTTGVSCRLIAQLKFLVQTIMLICPYRFRPIH